METSNQQLVQNLYALFSQGNLEGVLSLCTDDITFTVPGHTKFSGIHTKSDFFDWISLVMQLSGGTFREEIIDILVSDRRVLVLLNHWLERDGESHHYVTSHLWEMRDGKFCQWYELPMNPGEFERIWS